MTIMIQSLEDISIVEGTTEILTHMHPKIQTRRVML